MRWRVFAILPIFAGLMATSSYAAATHWTRLTTADFELYTSAGQSHGEETLRRFEGVRMFFLKALPSHSGAEFPVRLIEFGTEAEYRAFRPNDFTAAFFLTSPARDYIVMGDHVLRDPSIAVHEYVHLITQHSGLKMPLWLNEGWADVFSTLRPMGKETAVGDLIPGRTQVLMREPWLSFEELTRVDTNSPEYHEQSRAGMFYAESWALVHMLYLAPEYRDHFGKFVLALSEGSSAADACQMAFGRSSAEVFRDLHSYLDRKRLYGAVFQNPAEGRDAAPVARGVDDFESRLMLAELLTATGKGEQAAGELDSLSKEQPARADLAQALGNLALAKRDLEGARRSYEKAYDEGSNDPRMCLQLAALERIARQPPAKSIPILQRALRYKPGYTEASMQLGIAFLDARDFASSISTLNAIAQLAPEQAPTVFCGLSYAYIESGDLVSGKKNAETCRMWAKADAPRKRAEQLLKLAEARSKPAAAVHQGETRQQVAGVMKNLQCSPEGNRLQVTAGDKTLTFDLPSAEAVETTSALRLACGPQQPVRVGVEYAPPASAVATSAGVIRRLVF